MDGMEICSLSWRLQSSELHNGCKTRRMQSESESDLKVRGRRKKNCRFRELFCHREESRSLLFVSCRVPPGGKEYRDSETKVRCVPTSLTEWVDSGARIISRFVKPLSLGKSSNSIC